MMLTQPCLFNLLAVNDVIRPSDHFSNIISDTEVKNFIYD